MSQPDLFVVCKKCGSEVSPYVTECPYCGQRLRKRAPKIDRPDRPAARLPPPRPPRSWPACAPRRSPGSAPGPRPYATIALVSPVSLLLCVVTAIVPGPRWPTWAGSRARSDDEFWRGSSRPFVYDNLGYQFVALRAIASSAGCSSAATARRARVVVFVARRGAGSGAAAARPARRRRQRRRARAACAWSVPDRRAPAGESPTPTCSASPSWRPACCCPGGRDRRTAGRGGGACRAGAGVLLARLHRAAAQGFLGAWRSAPTPRCVFARERRRRGVGSDPVHAQRVPSGVGSALLDGLGAGWGCEAVEHQADHRPFDHRLVRLGQPLVVAHEPSPAQPARRRCVPRPSGAGAPRSRSARRAS